MHGSAKRDEKSWMVDMALPWHWMCRTERLCPSTTAARVLAPIFESIFGVKLWRWWSFSSHTATSRSNEMNGRLRANGEEWQQLSIAIPVSQPTWPRRPTDPGVGLFSRSPFFFSFMVATMLVPLVAFIVLSCSRTWRKVALAFAVLYRASCCCGRNRRSDVPPSAFRGVCARVRTCFEHIFVCLFAIKLTQYRIRAGVRCGVLLLLFIVIEAKYEDTRWKLINFHPNTCAGRRLGHFIILRNICIRTTQRNEHNIGNNFETIASLCLLLQRFFGPHYIYVKCSLVFSSCTSSHLFCFSGCLPAPSIPFATATEKRELFFSWVRIKNTSDFVPDAGIRPANSINFSILHTTNHTQYSSLSAYRLNGRRSLLICIIFNYLSVLSAAFEC